MKFYANNAIARMLGRSRKGAWIEIAVMAAEMSEEMQSLPQGSVD